MRAWCCWMFAWISLFSLYIGQLQANPPTILVSVAPHKFFVEKIAGDTLSVYLMVPAGASAHTYEPTPKQMLRASQGQIWFRIGEAFETRAIQALKSHNPTLKLIDLRHGLDLILTDHKHEHCSCCQSAMDLHFWLSARQAQIQAQTIAEALSETYPEHRALYTSNLKTFQQELKELDQQIQTVLAPLKNRAVLVSHPAYAYFCRDYALEQYSIEVEGKDPTPQQMTKLLNLARRLAIGTIFIQPQYNNKAAHLVSQELGTKLVVLDPYSEQYFKSMLDIAHAFAEG